MIPYRLLVMCSSSLLLSVAAAQTVHGVQTSVDLRKMLAPLPAAKFTRSSANADATITVDETKRFQTIDGFGAAFVEGSAYLLQHDLTPQQRSDVMTRLFDPKRGIGLSAMRLPIASTDLSRTHYSYDDMPEGQSDPEMQHFSVEKDRADVFPTVREALKLNPRMTLIASPWSMPAWMKTKPTMNGGALRQDAETAFAKYLVRSLQAFAKEGITPQYLTIQNEPLNETKNYPGSLLLADQAARFIGKDLGPALRAANLKTHVLAYDHNWDHPEYPLSVIADPSARPYMAGSAMHCYGGKADVQDDMHAKDPQMGIWMTECSGGTWQKEAPLAVTAHLVISSTQHWAKAVTLWGIALDPKGNPHAGGCGTCRGLLTIDSTQKPSSITWNGDFYALAHASKYVHPGAVHIASSTTTDGVDQVAFQDTDGTIVLIAYNDNAETKTVNVQWRARTVHLSLPATSLVTYTWKAAR
ncbi:glycoside hydrolase family 30 beta sandwich domain-containing protein [Terriglobus sp. TAA 43]|uniref:glycoside hydrolase family 30 protein n=1 Tax=Terriglobus sp. TAA 43 TaxID=278961 RepID=UPI0012EDCACB|nr:glycoside hydrolase family 30 beta sandwich domain-containing protein [Terriglobus sp. TAA 43]